MVRVTPPDLELFLTRYLRERAAERGETVDVDNKEPGTLNVESAPLIVVRDDSGTRLDWPSFDRSVGVSVLAGTRMFTKPANDLAREVFADLTDDVILTWPGSPIASVEWDGCNGPYPVADALDVARRYMTVQYVAVGSW